MVKLTFSRVLLAIAVLSLVVAVPLISCGQTEISTELAISDGDQADVLNAQKAHLKKVEITVTAPVYKILKDDQEGIPHQRFLIWLRNGRTVLIAHDIRMAPRVPVRAGDLVQIHGEYIWNEKGGVIHWTHHTDTARHEGGWIDFQGVRYE